MERSVYLRAGRRRPEAWWSAQAKDLLDWDSEPPDELLEEVRAEVAERIRKYARPKRIIWAEDLPKTRSRRCRVGTAPLLSS